MYKRQIWNDVSNENAEIKSQFIPAGTYILKETKAPNAYQLSDEEWTITITEKGNVSVKDKSGATISCLLYTSRLNCSFVDA